MINWLVGLPLWLQLPVTLLVLIPLTALGSRALLWVIDALTGDNKG